jgi:hypothetical protein
MQTRDVQQIRLREILNFELFLALIYFPLSIILRLCQKLDM